MPNQWLRIKRIDHINFACSNMHRTIAFWENIGVKCSLNLHLHDPERNHIFFTVGESEHEQTFNYWYWPDRTLTPAQEHEQRDHAGFYHLAFYVENVDELEEMHALLESKGVPVSGYIDKHMFDRSFTFRDPDNIQFEFACPLLSLKGPIDHDGNGTLTPLSKEAMLDHRRLDGPVHFETQYK